MKNQPYCIPDEGGNVLQNDTQSLITLANTLSLNAVLIFQVLHLWRELVRERNAHIATLKQVAKLPEEKGTEKSEI